MVTYNDAKKFAIDKGTSAYKTVKESASSVFTSVKSMGSNALTTAKNANAGDAKKYATNTINSAKQTTMELVKSGTNKITKTDSEIIVGDKSNKVTTKKGKPLPPILGYPPEPRMEETSNALINSSIILEITPCKASMQSGTTLFSLTSAMNEYTEKLRKIGYESSDKNVIRIRAEADITPSETFNNDYGDSFLAKIAEAASAGVSDITQITGAQSGPEAGMILSSELEKFTEGVPILSGISSEAKNQFESLNKWYKKNENTMHGAVGMVGAMLGGARVDFPQVWKNSAYTTSYSITIKLYNPSPGSDNALEYFIIGPLAAILLLGLPMEYKSGKSMRFYNYPYFHKIKCKGLFELEKGAIQSISVTKGIEGQIGFNQRLGMVEVKMDFINLHNHMLGSHDASNEAMPTLMKYINNLKEEAIVRPMYGEYGYGSELTSNGLFADSNMPTTQNDPLLGAAERINGVTKTISDTLSAINPPTLRELPDRILSSLEPVAPEIVSQTDKYFRSSQALKASILKAKSTTISKTLAAKSRILRAKNTYRF